MEELLWPSLVEISQEMLKLLAVEVLPEERNTKETNLVAESGKVKKSAEKRNSLIPASYNVLNLFPFPSFNSSFWRLTIYLMTHITQHSLNKQKTEEMHCGKTLISSLPTTLLLSPIIPGPPKNIHPSLGTTCFYKHKPSLLSSYPLNCFRRPKLNITF